MTSITTAGVLANIGVGLGTDINKVPKPMFIPYWITSALAMNGLDVHVFKDVEALKKYISRDMLADFVAVNRYLLVNDFITPKYMNSLHGIYQVPGMEYLIDTEIHARKDAAIATLGLPMEAVPPTNLYRIQELDHEVFLIFVEPGFTTHLLRFRDQALAFISECLRTQYRFASISNVAQTDLYWIYLNLLSEKAPYPFQQQ